MDQMIRPAGRLKRCFKNPWVESGQGREVLETSWVESGRVQRGFRVSRGRAGFHQPRKIQSVLLRSSQVEEFRRSETNMPDGN